MPGPLLLTTAETARALGLSERTIRRLIASGKLRSVSIGGARRVPAVEIERFVTDLIDVGEAS